MPYNLDHVSSWWSTSGSATTWTQPKPRILSPKKQVLNKLTYFVQYKAKKPEQCLQQVQLNNRRIQVICAFQTWRHWTFVPSSKARSHNKGFRNDASACTLNQRIEVFSRTYLANPNHSQGLKKKSHPYEDSCVLSSRQLGKWKSGSGAGNDRGEELEIPLAQKNFSIC